MKQHERVSFSRIGDVMSHAVDYLSHVRDMLDELRAQQAQGREQMLLDSFLLEQRNLLGAIERYADDAPDKISNTFTNYAVELPAALEGPQQPLTTLSLTQWLGGLNQHLVRVFEEVAESADVDDVRAAMQGLAEQTLAHERKLSKEYQRFEDL